MAAMRLSRMAALAAAAAVLLAWPTIAQSDVPACANDPESLQGLLIAENRKEMGCAELAAMHVCDHPEKGAQVRDLCPASCGLCTPACVPKSTTTADDNVDIVDDTDDSVSGAVVKGKHDAQCFAGPFGLSDLENKHFTGQTDGELKLAEILDIDAPAGMPFDVTPLTDKIKEVVKDTGVNAGLAEVNVIKGKSLACSKLPMDPAHIGLYAMLNAQQASEVELKLFGGVMKDLPETCFVWDRCTKGVTLGVGLNTPLALTLVPTPIRVKMDAFALSSSGDLVAPGTKTFWNPAAAASGATTFEFKDTDGHHGFAAECKIYPIAGNDDTYAAGSISAGASSLVAQAAFHVKQSFGSMLALDLHLDKVQVAAAWGTAQPTRPQGLYVHTQTGLTSIKQGIQTSGTLKKVLDFSGEGAANKPFDLAVMETGVAARFSMGVSLLGSNVEVDTVVCANLDEAKEVCKPTYEIYASNKPQAWDKKIAFFVDFQAKGSISLGAISGGTKHLITVPTLQGTAVVGFAGEFSIKGQGTVAWPDAQKPVSAQFTFDDSSAKFAMNNVPFYSFTAKVANEITWGSMTGGAPDMAVDINIDAAGAIVLTQGCVDYIQAQINVAQAAFDDAKATFDDAKKQVDDKDCSALSWWYRGPCEAAKYTLQQGMAQLELVVQGAQVLADGVKAGVAKFGDVKDVVQINSMAASATLNFATLQQSEYTFAVDAVLAKSPYKQSIAVDLNDVSGAVSILGSAAWAQVKTLGSFRRKRRSTDFVKRLGALPPKEREAVEEKLADMFAGVFTPEEIQDITATF